MSEKTAVEEYISTIENVYLTDPPKLDTDLERRLFADVCVMLGIIHGLMRKS